jgi:protein-S-isoprenylcysteine O-methyltransferase Ste14
VRVFAWSGAVLFVGALAYFLFSYSLRFSVVTPGPPSGAATIINAALFSVFALHHSVFARERVRAAVARLVPAGLERSFYVWVASLLLVAVCAAWQPVGGVAWDVDAPLRGALLGLQAIGIWLTIHSAAVIDVFDLAGLGRGSHVGRGSRPSTSSGRPEPAEGRSSPGEVEFKTSGPYGWVRHPIYTGWFLIVFAVGTMTMTRLSFAVISSLYVLIAIPFEERSLRATTSGAYNRYAGEVTWKLFPGLY